MRFQRGSYGIAKRRFYKVHNGLLARVLIQVFPDLVETLVRELRFGMAYAPRVQVGEMGH